jgi:hypothetical protein
MSGEFSEADIFPWGSIASCYNLGNLRPCYLLGVAGERVFRNGALDNPRATLIA